MPDYKFVIKRKKVDVEKWVEIDDLELIKEIASTEYYEKIPGIDDRVKKTAFYYTSDLEKVEDGVCKFLCSIENIYLNTTMFVEEMKGIIAVLKKNKPLAMAMYTIFFPNATAKKDLDHFNKVPFRRLEAAVNKYNNDLKDQF